MSDHREGNHQPIIIVGEQDKKKDMNAAVTSMVLGIFSILFCWLPYITIFLSLAGLIFGIISLAKRQEGQGMAIAGVIISVFGILLSIFMGIVWLTVLYLMPQGLWI